MRYVVLLCIVLGGCTVSPTKPILNNDLDELKFVTVDPIKSLPIPVIPQGEVHEVEGTKFLSFDKQGIDELRQLKHVAITNTETLNVAIDTVVVFGEQYNEVVGIAKGEQESHNKTKVLAAQADTKARQEAMESEFELMFWRSLLTVLAVLSLL